MLFPVTSRYYGIATQQFEAADGRKVVYLSRRFLPQTSNSIAIAEHVATQGERLDNITALYIGDPEQFWRVCDANNAMHPDEMTAEIGRRLRIPLPQAGGF